MPRFFHEAVVPPDQAVIHLSGDDFHHIHDVLRLKAGDAITVCDGAGTDLAGQISRYGESTVEVSIFTRSMNQSEPPYRVTLYQGMAKGDKMESIIQKSVELGVSQLVLMICSRCVSLPEKRDYAGKLTRWNRIAAEAAKQSGRGLRPTVGPILSFQDALASASAADIRMIPWELEREQSIRTVLESWQQTASGKPYPAISVLIGPEGGFSQEEIQLAAASGLQPVTLGRRILRTETAGPAVLAMILYQFNNF